MASENLSKAEALNLIFQARHEALMLRELTSFSKNPLIAKTAASLCAKLDRLERGLEDCRVAVATKAGTVLVER